ncbi:MAG: alpha/beta hydrolase, partial [Paraburkholderia graminis]
MSWQSALACWFLRRQFRPQTLKPHIDVHKARALTAKRVWSP